jgi:ferredoxin
MSETIQTQVVIVAFEVDQPSCIGCGNCWVANPDLFREVKIGNDYKAATVCSEVTDEPKLRLAATGCPSLSIHLIAEGGEIAFPTPEARAERDRKLAW